MAYALMARPGYASDFFHYWAAARTLLEGGNPYLTIPSGPLNPGLDPAKYPLPAYLLIAPLAWLPLPVAGGVFMAVLSGLCALGVARTGIDRFPLFLSAPFLLALSLGQWSPLFVAAALMPVLSPLIVAKPNLAVGVFLARPLRLTVIGALVLTAISIPILPTWPRDWLANLAGREEKFIPLFRPGGFALLLALLAWRRIEGRLLIGMSVVPQALLFYDQLLLWLIPRTRRQGMALSFASLGLFLLWRRRLQPGDFEVQEAVPYAHAVYGVALLILLWNWYGDRRRQTAPNEARTAGGGAKTEEEQAPAVGR